MSEPCVDCPEPQEGSLRVVRWRAWFEGDRSFNGQTLADWAALPDDGMLGFMLYYERKGHRRNAAGNNWYWAVQGPRDVIYAHGDEPREEIERRYPGAIVKRGKWTDDITIELVGKQMTEAA